MENEKKEKVDITSYIKKIGDVKSKVCDPLYQEATKAKIAVEESIKNIKNIIANRELEVNVENNAEPKKVESVQDVKKEETVKQPEEVKVQEVKKEEKPQEPKVEVKAEKPQETKPQEVKKEEKPQEIKVEDAKPEVKVEPKNIETPKAEPKKEEPKKEEMKKEEPKAEKKVETKKVEATKAEPKKEEPQKPVYAYLDANGQRTTREKAMASYADKANNANRQNSYNNNRQNGYNNNNNNGQRPQGGYNNNRPNNGQQNNGPRPQGGFNNNRPQQGAQGGFNRPAAPKVFEPVIDPLDKNRIRKEKKDPPKKEAERKGLNKRELIKKGYEVDSSLMSDQESIRLKKKRDKKEKKETSYKQITEAVFTTDNIPMKVFCETIGRPATEVIQKLFLLGKMITINGVINFEEASLIADEFGVKITRVDQSAEKKLQDELEIKKTVDVSKLKKRPPIVTIMGHVDHGKTTLLDYIRKSNVAGSEAGGITQHIGAYTIDVRGEKITFLDTPGHEAFTAMRKRGANVTDIAIIVIAADDMIMPQTVEAINHAKQAGVSIIIAVNKMDKAREDSITKLSEQLFQNGLTTEAWGGDVIVCPISAKFGTGVDQLLDSVLLVAEMLELKADKTAMASGTVVESRLDKNIGPVATVLVKDGTLKVKDVIVTGKVYGKVRAMTDFNGKPVKEAGPSYAVQIQGLSEVPNAGDKFFVVQDSKLAKEVVDERIAKERSGMVAENLARTIDEMFKDQTTNKILPVIVKTDVQGTCEAVCQSLKELSNSKKEDNVQINIVSSGVGIINESDVMLANTTHALMLAFNVKADAKARAYADKEKVEIRSYRVIYDALDDINDALNAMLTPKYTEKVIGHAEIRAVFKLSSGIIAGSYVLDGKIERNAKFNLIRGNETVATGQIVSVRREKDDVKEVAAGYECGISLDFKEFKKDDRIECFILEKETK